MVLAVHGKLGQVGREGRAVRSVVAGAAAAGAVVGHVLVGEHVGADGAADDGVVHVVPGGHSALRAEREVGAVEERRRVEAVVGHRDRRRRRAVDVQLRAAARVQLHRVGVLLRDVEGHRDLPQHRGARRDGAERHEVRDRAASVRRLADAEQRGGRAVRRDQPRRDRGLRGASRVHRHVVVRLHGDLRRDRDVRRPDGLGLGAGVGGAVRRDPVDGVAGRRHHEVGSGRNRAERLRRVALRRAERAGAAAARAAGVAARRSRLEKRPRGHRVRGREDRPGQATCDGIGQRNQREALCRPRLARRPSIVNASQRSSRGNQCKYGKTHHDNNSLCLTNHQSRPRPIDTDVRRMWERTCTPRTHFRAAMEALSHIRVDARRRVIGALGIPLMPMCDSGSIQ